MRIEHWFYTLPLRLRSLFRRHRVEQELDEELQYHLEQKTQAYIAQGVMPDEARLAALRSMHGLTQRKEECRDTRKVNLIDHTLQDIRYSMRLIRHSPGFTAAAVLTLALAICANSVVFGILNAFVLRPLDLPDAGSLYSIQRTADKYGAESYPTYLDLRDRNRSFQDLAAFTIDAAGLDAGEGNPARVWLKFVSGNYFDVLRIRPHLGRLFQASDERGPNSAPYIVLSHAFWHAYFRDDPRVIGRVVRVNKHPFTILGVAPPDFRGTLLFFHPDFFLPMVNQEQINGTSWLTTRNSRSVFQMMGHLKPGSTPEQATADLNAIGASVEKTYPKDVASVKYSLVRPTFNGDFLGRPIRAFVVALMLLAALILLAACANLGSLFAARAADRGREVALRLALGAGRNRVLRQLLTEAAILSLIGGAIGLAGSIELLRALSAWQPLSRFPIRVPVHADETVYAMALALALVSAILFGLVPARQVRRTDPYQVIKAGPTAKAGRFALRDVLLLAQVAICSLLVTSSIVAARGLLRSLHGDVGFEPRGAMLANTVPGMAGYRGDSVIAMQKRMIDAMETIPGVTSVALTSTPPLDQAWENVSVYRDDIVDLRPSNAAARPFVYRISPEYFRTARTPVLSGRSLTWHDDAKAPRVAVVNREFARRMFGSAASAMGRAFRLRDGTRIQVVGIVENGKYMNLTEDPQPAMFLPILQSPSSESWLIVRSDRDPQALAAAIRSKLHELDPALPAFIVTWQQDLEGALFASRVATVALGVMGLLGAVLAVTGIFGMAAYSVSRRLRELGIRMALGAQRLDVLKSGLGRAFRLLAFGSLAGLLLGLLFTRVLAAIVYQATPRDPLVLSGVVVAMLLLGLLATWIPAQRALSVSPAELLREE